MQICIPSNTGYSLEVYRFASAPFINQLGQDLSRMDVILILTQVFVNELVNYSINHKFIFSMFTDGF